MEFRKHVGPLRPDARTYNVEYGQTVHVGHVCEYDGEIGLERSAKCDQIFRDRPVCHRIERRDLHDESSGVSRRIEQE